MFRSTMLPRTRAFTTLGPFLRRNWLIGLATLAVVASAQTEPAEPAPPEITEAEEPTTLDLAQVPSAAARLETTLTDFANADNASLRQEIEAGMPLIRESVQQASRRLVSMRDHSVSSQRVVAVRTSLASSERQLRAWQTSLSSSIARTEEALAETQALSIVWTNTRDQAIADDAPGTLITQLRATLSRVNRTHRILEDHRAASLEAQGSVGLELRRLGRVDDEIDALLAASRSTLFKPDSPPLWQIFGAGRPSQVIEDLRRYLRENTEVLIHWIGQHTPSLSLWGFSFVLMLLFIFSARRKHLDTLEADERLQTSTTLVKHPFSTSILLALLLVPVLLRERTEAFGWIVTLLAVPALLRFIPALIPERAQTLARGVVLVYLLVRLALLFPESSNPARLLYIVSEAVIAVGGIRFLRNPGAEPSRHAILATIVRIMAFLAMVAFGAHLFGYSLLGATLIQGAAISAFLGLTLMSISSVAAAFFRLLAILGPLRHLESIKRHYTLMERQFRRILFWFILIIWITHSLRGFTVSEFVFRSLTELLRREWQFGSITLTLGSIVWFVLSVWIAVIISRMLRFFLENDVLSRLGLPRGVPSTISMMLHYGIVSLGFLVALAALGIELSQLSIVIGALGVGIGFGLQNVVNNFISGLILVFERPISVGDVVQFGTTSGKVTRIGLRSSIVRDFEGAEIIVPNGNLISNEVTNWTLSDETRRITIPVQVPFDSDADEVIALLEKTAGEHELVAEEPAPWAVFEGFGESSLLLSLRCWAHSSVFLKAKSSLSVDIDRALKAAGIKIPYPQRQLHVTDGSKSTSAPGGDPPLADGD